MNIKTKQILAVMTLKEMYRKRFLYWDGQEAIIKFTDIGGDRESTYDCLTYFSPIMDNGDVAFDVVEQVTGFKDAHITKDIYFFLQLILEDIYETKVSKYTGFTRVDKNDYHFVGNLTTEYREWVEEQRQVIFALLNGGYYDEFTGE